MSFATIDSELRFERSPTDLGASRFKNLRQFSKRPSSPLWGFDEPDERERYERIQKRLIRLEAALFEEFGNRIDTTSRNSLLRLFVTCPSVRAPSISSSAEGFLTATWRAQNGEELVVRCFAHDAIHYAIASRSAAQAMDRTWGTCHSPSLFFSENALARRIAT